MICKHPRRALICATLFLAGCAATPVANFYTLAATASAQAVPASCASIGVGPVWIPDEVDRPQMILRVGANRLAIDELHRWAAPLAAAIGRVVAEDLSLLLATVAAPYPEGIQLETPCRVEIQVLRFDSTPGVGARLEALWSVRSGGEAKSAAAKGEAAKGEAAAPQQVWQTGRTRVEEPAGAPGIDALAAAHSRALAVLAGDIAAALRAP